MNNALTVEDVLDKGIFGLSEAAHYTGLPIQRIRSWFAASVPGRKAVFDADYEKFDGTHAISFLDLIDVLVAGKLRDHAVSMQTVRKAYARLRDDWGLDHPFCHQGIYTDGRTIFLEVANLDGDCHFAEVFSSQKYFGKVMDEHLRRVDYDAETGLAQRWRIAAGVVIDPRIHFGKPVVENTGVATRVLASAYYASGHREEDVSRLYGVDVNAVRNAVSFEQAFAKPSSA